MENLSITVDASPRKNRADSPAESNDLFDLNYDYQQLSTSKPQGEVKLFTFDSLSYRSLAHNQEIC